MKVYFYLWRDSGIPLSLPRISMFAYKDCFSIFSFLKLYHTGKIIITINSLIKLFHKNSGIIYNLHNLIYLRWYLLRLFRFSETTRTPVICASSYAISYYCSSYVSRLTFSCINYREIINYARSDRGSWFHRDDTLTL